MALALGFSLPSLSYSLGTLGRAGPGMFPFIVSCMLFVIGVITVVRARLVATNVERGFIDFEQVD